MTYHNAVKRVLTAPMGSDPRSAERLSLLCRFFDLPLKGMTMVKIHGQMGKSACASLLARALMSADYRVGMLTTPFAHTITECIVTNDHAVSIEQFTSSIETTLAAVTTIREDMASLSVRADEENGDSLSAYERSLLSYRSTQQEFALFSDELLLIAALRIFCEQKCQVVILEVPSDNRAGAYRLPVAPTVSVITSTETARVAERICRTLERNTPEVVSALQEKSVYNMIADACADINCRLSMPLKSAYYHASLTPGRMSLFYKNAEHTLNSGARYQALNLLTVSETLDALKRHGISAKFDCLNLSRESTPVLPKTHFAFLSIHPTLILDSANTPERLTAFSQSLHAHKELVGHRITDITDGNTLSDILLTETFAKQDFDLDSILRIDPITARRDLKPLVKSLTPDTTCVILGDRPFTYEAARALQSLLAL